MLFARGWTDGLPVVFPTVNKVAAMVEASGRDAKGAGRAGSRRAGAMPRSKRLQSMR